MAKTLSKQDKKFVDKLVEHGNKTKAAQEAYNLSNPNSAHVKAHRMLQNATIVNAIEEAFPDHELFELHREGLFDEDLVVRHKYLDTAYKLKGSYAAEKHANLNVNIDISKNEDIQALADKAAELLREKKLHGDTGTTDRT